MVGDLSVGERQRVEILKALYRDARILILDEPTAVLTPQEIDSLFETLQRLVERGLSIVFISHKLHEILRISSRVMVLRRGKVAGIVATAEADRDILAELMVGHAVNRPKAEPMAPGEPVLELRSASVHGKGNRPLLDRIDLTVHRHEIVGIAGVAGNGQGPLADLVNGLLSPDDGEIRYFGQPIGRTSPDKVVHLGVGRIPEDRHAAGIVGEMEVWENLISENLRHPPVSRAMFLNRTACRRQAEDLIRSYDVRCEGPDAETRLLSGGNIQKLILARALSPEPGLIVANQPVRGLDEGAIAYVHEQLLAARQRGAGILLITEDLDELLALADQVVVIYHGAVSAPIPAKSATARQLGLMMSGQMGSETTPSLGAA
jgi:simple sugar transport system ATP-binding protein